MLTRYPILLDMRGDGLVVFFLFAFAARAWAQRAPASLARLLLHETAVDLARKRRGACAGGGRFICDFAFDFTSISFLFARQNSHNPR